MENLLQRERTDAKDRTYGEWFINGMEFCLSLEDRVRESPGRPWHKGLKVYGKTAIPAGRYRLTLEDSPHFGPNTITINEVPNYEGVRVHSGVTILDTLGCVLLGDRKTSFGIAGGINHQILRNLKARIQAALDDGEDVWLTVQNAA